MKRRSSAMAISSAKPMPTKPPVATVSPSRISFTASAAETTCLFLIALEEGQGGMVHGWALCVAVVAGQRSGEAIRLKRGRHMGICPAIQAMAGGSRPPSWRSGLARFRREEDRDDGDQRQPDHVERDRPGLRQAVIRPVAIGGERACQQRGRL